MKKIHNSQFTIHNSLGAGLLELMLALAVFAGMLPFAYRFAIERGEKAENAAIVRRIEIARNALEKYISANKQKLLAPVSENVTRVKLSELKDIPAGELDGANIQLRIVKSKDSGGRAFVQGIVIFDDGRLTPLRTRQIALAGGPDAGFADGRMLHGSFGTWRAPQSAVDAAVGSHSVLAQTRPFRNGGDYLQRLPSENRMDATMQSDLNMGGHNITDVKTLSAGSSRFLESLSADSIEASKMTVANRLDWTAGIDVFGTATVNGALTSDNRSIEASQISVAGRSQFRSVTADELMADNLYLSGFSTGGGSGRPSVLSVSGALDMTKGHIKAMNAFIEFSGSVAPKLIVNSRIEDAADAGLYWELSSGAAVLTDLHLTGANQMIKRVYSGERTGKTETERLMGNVIMNSNATVSDFIRALEQSRRAVEAKYSEIQGAL